MPSTREPTAHTHTHTRTAQEPTTHTHTPTAREPTAHTHTHTPTAQEPTAHTHTPTAREQTAHTHLLQENRQLTHTHLLHENRQLTHTHTHTNCPSLPLPISPDLTSMQLRNPSDCNISRVRPFSPMRSECVALRTALWAVWWRGVWVVTAPPVGTRCNGEMMGGVK